MPPLCEPLLPGMYTCVDDDPPEDDQYGRTLYLRKCSELGISPASQVMKFLETEDMHIHHYGLGLKGTRALLEALKASGQQCWSGAVWVNLGPFACVDDLMDSLKCGQSA